MEMENKKRREKILTGNKPEPSSSRLSFHSHNKITYSALVLNTILGIIISNTSSYQELSCFIVFSIRSNIQAANIF